MTLLTKRCGKCKLEKPVTQFSKKKKSKDGLQGYCTPCKALWYRENEFSHKANVQFWDQNNPDRRRAIGSEYRARKLERMLKWGKEMHRPEIENWHRRARLATLFMGELYEVDHIEPLYGKTVCGLHVPWNLTLLTKPENSGKGNRRAEEKPAPPIPIEHVIIGKPYSPHRLVLGTRTWEDRYGSDYYPGESPWQDLDSCTEESSGDRLVTGMWEMGAFTLTYNGKSYWIPSAAGISLEQLERLIYCKFRELGLVTGKESEVRLSDNRRKQSVQRSKHEKV